MIHKVNGRYVISSYSVWRPGAYDSEKTARYAFQFDDSDLSVLMDRANEENRVITKKDLQQLREKVSSL